jgi:hypothetical protein
LSRQGKARQGPETSIHIGYICAWSMLSYSKLLEMEQRRKIGCWLVVWSR